MPEKEARQSVPDWQEDPTEDCKICKVIAFRRTNV